jgi:hypothetical protein
MRRSTAGPWQQLRRLFSWPARSWPALHIQTQNKSRPATGPAIQWSTYFGVGALAQFNHMARPSPKCLMVCAKGETPRELLLLSRSERHHHIIWSVNGTYFVRAIPGYMDERVDVKAIIGAQQERCRVGAKIPLSILQVVRRFVPYSALSVPGIGERSSGSRLGSPLGVRRSVGARAKRNRPRSNRKHLVHDRLTRCRKTSARIRCAFELWRPRR